MKQETPSDPPETITCDRCDREVSSESYVELKGLKVCSSCKPEVVQRIKSGAPVDIPSDEEKQQIKDELRKLNLYSFLFGVPGLGLQIVGNLMTGPQVGTNMMGIGGIIMIAGTVLFITGLVYYARMRNRNGMWGLLGILSCIGILVLYFFRPICRYCESTNSYRNDNCKDCGAPLS